MDKIEDLIIIGGGPAGYTAAIYAAREDFKPLVISGFQAGGQLMLTNEVENYPGFPDGVLGPDLMDLFRKQAEKFGARFINDNVTDVDFTKRPFRIVAEGKEYLANCVIIALGASAKWLGLESEKRLIGKGVSSCGTCMPPSSLVVANASTIQISDVVPGSRVLTHDGTFKPVSALTKRRYSGKLIRFRTRFFRSEDTLLTPNHPLLVKTLKRNYYHGFEWSEPFWINASELNKNHIMLYPIPKKEYTGEILYINKELDLELDGKYVKLPHETYTSHRIKNKISIDKNFARLIGYYLSEGFSHSKGISFAFNTDEEDYVLDCNEILYDKFGVRGLVKTEGKVRRIDLNSKILGMLFEKLFGKYSHTKRLPHKFILLEKNLQKEIVKGLWRGDGCIRKKDFIITSSSRELIEQTKLILLRNNILPGVEMRKFTTLRYSRINGREVEFKHPVYQLIVGGPWLATMSELLDVPHPKLKIRKHTCKHAWIEGAYAMLPIKGITHEYYDGIVYNIAVKDNNTYVTTNSIVHNCDGPFYKNKNVVLVGGGDTAMEDALFLTKFASSVTIVHRKDSFRASKIMQARVLSNPKIKVMYDSVVEEVLGKDKVTGVRIKNIKTNKTTNMDTDGLFVAIGYSPNTSFLKGKLKLDEHGYIVTKDEVKTDIKGVFVAGDVADRVYRQAVTAAGSGTKAALEARAYLQELKYEKSK